MLGNKKRNPFVILAARAGPGDRLVHDHGQGTRSRLAGCARRGAPGTYKYLTVYSVLHVSDFTATAALLFNFPVGGPMQSF